MNVDATSPSSTPLDGALATTITFVDGAIQVPAAVIALGLNVEASRVHTLMRNGEVTSLCEKGEDKDAGRCRLTFFYKSRRLQLVIDSTGKIVQRSVIDFGDRALPASLHIPGM